MKTINIKFINRLKAKQVIKNVIQGAGKGTMVYSSAQSPHMVAHNHLQLCPGDPRLFWSAWAPVLLYTYLHTDIDTDAQFKNVIQVERYFKKFNA